METERRELAGYLEEVGITHGDIRIIWPSHFSEDTVTTWQRYLDTTLGRGDFEINACLFFC